MNNRDVGKQYEELVCRYMQEKGMKILDTNYQIRQGEIDIIARDGVYLVFVEVKYRKNASGGSPLEAVSISKQRKICKTALHYMYVNHYSVENTSVRFDVAGVTGRQLQYIENAFSFI